MLLATPWMSSSLRRQSGQTSSSNVELDPRKSSCAAVEVSVILRDEAPMMQRSIQQQPLLILLIS